MRSNRSAGDRAPLHWALCGLGQLARGDVDRATEHFAAGLALVAELRAAYFIKSLAELAAGRGRAAEAVRLLGAAETAVARAGRGDGAGRPGRHGLRAGLGAGAVAAAGGGDGRGAGAG